jgi:hypothetical protein
MADQTKRETDSAFEPTERIESFLIGFLYFLKQIFCTLGDLAFNQSRFSKILNSGDKSKRYTKPVTFITLMSFLTIRIFRLGVLVILLVFNLASCETQTRAKYPSLQDELQVPSLTEIILYGIPILILVLLFSQVLKFVLLKGSAKSGDLLAAVSYYAVGFQYFMYLLIVALFSLFIYFEPEIEDSIVFITVSLLLLWIILVAYRLVAKTIEKKDLRVSTIGLKQIWLLLWSLLLMVLTTLSGAGITFFLAQLEAEELKSKPVLSIGLIDSDNSKEDEFSVNVLVRNNSDEELVLLSNQITTHGYHGEIVKSNIGYEDIIILRSNEVGWLKIVFSKSDTEQGSGSFDPWDLIKFTALSPSGEHKTISAYIRSEGEIVDISALE